MKDHRHYFSQTKKRKMPKQNKDDYVNQAGVIRTIPMGKRAVEKPVEIVEKYEFSTAMGRFSNSASRENKVRQRKIIKIRRFACEIMLPL